MVSTGAGQLDQRLAAAVAACWKTCHQQAIGTGRYRGAGCGSRGHFSGGHQMRGFKELITELLSAAGVAREDIFHGKALGVPGFFSATTKWDVLVVHGCQLIAAVELGFLAGPFFGRSFSQCTGGALAMALDVWAAYRQGALNRAIRPWLGYLLLVEDCEESRWPVRVVEPHFKALPEFKGASFVPRCEQLCRKFMRERYYDATALLLSPRKEGRSGAYVQPADDLSFEVFARSLTTYAAAFG